MPKRKRDNRTTRAVDDRKSVAVEQPAPTPRRYTPPECSLCQADRPAGEDYASVYAVRRQTEAVVRYCRCRFCGNTYKAVELLK